jgi:hypothetical protein
MGFGSRLVVGIVLLCAVCIGLVLHQLGQFGGGGQAGVGKANFKTVSMTDKSDLPPWWLYRFVVTLDRWLVALRRALLPPAIYTYDLLTTQVFSQGLNVAAKLELADLIGDGTKSATELAETVNVNAENLYRVLRALAGIGYFVEVEDGVFGNTELSSILRKDHPNSIRNTVMLPNEPIHWQALGGMLRSVQKPGPGFQSIYPGQDYWSFHEDNRDLQFLFDQAMTETATLGNKALIEDYEWEKCTKLVDLAGGKGDFVRQLLKKHQNLSAILFDQPWVIEAAVTEWAEAEGNRDLLPRIKFVTGNFLESIPSDDHDGADCWVMRGILHDWNDAKAQLILQNVRKAMVVDKKKNNNNTQKLILLEPDFMRPYEQDATRLALDLVMMTLVDGKGRSKPQFEKLLAASGFGLSAIRDTRGLFTIVEAAPK